MIDGSSTPLKADIGPIIIVVLFCIFASSIGKVQNIHKPGPWVLKLRKTEIGKLIPIYPLRPTFKVDFCKILCSEAMGAGSLTPGDEPWHCGSAHEEKSLQSIQY